MCRGKRSVACPLHPDCRQRGQAMRTLSNEDVSSGVTRLIRGGIAGLAATAPMTALMVLGHQRLPWHERRPLPPGLITAELRKAAGMSPPPAAAQAGIALINHFGYGALMGALYGLLPVRMLRDHPLASGAAFALAVWAGNYLALLPLLDLHRSARDDGASRNRVMIAAHLVWGVGPGLLAAAMHGTESGREPTPR